MSLTTPTGVWKGQRQGSACSPSGSTSGPGTGCPQRLGGSSLRGFQSRLDVGLGTSWGALLGQAWGLRNREPCQPQPVWDSVILFIAVLVHLPLYERFLVIHSDIDNQPREHLLKATLSIRGIISR